MTEKLSGFGRRLTGYVVIVLAVVVLGWIAIKVVSGFLTTLLIIALVVAALFALNWGLGSRKSG